MTIQHWMKQATDSALNGLIIPQRIFNSGGTGAEKPGDSPTRPFAVIRNDLDAPGVLPSFPISQLRWSIWLHDEPGSMKTINAGVQRVKTLVPQFNPQGQDVWVMECSWQASGPDSYDDHYKTMTRYVDFLATFKTTD